MMMLSCKDIDSSADCSFEASGNTAAEVAGKMMNHVRLDHPEKMEEMSNNDMMNMFKSKVHG